MAEDIRSWISEAIVQRDQTSGASLEAVSRVYKYGQLIKFNTYRTPDHPKAQITGILSDRTHHIQVAFDVAQTDEFERSLAGLQPETLTSHLRAVFRIKYARFRMEPRKRDEGSILPVVVMEVLDWEVVAGSRDDPVFWEDTVEIGVGKDDAMVRMVLDKWWTGESFSDPSQPGGSAEDVIKMEEERLAAAPQAPQTRTNSRSVSTVMASEEPIELADYLQPFLSGQRKGKPIPEWIFEIPDHIRSELDSIKVFAVDVLSDYTEGAQGEPQDIDADETEEGPMEGDADVEMGEANGDAEAEVEEGEGEDQPLSIDSTGLPGSIPLPPCGQPLPPTQSTSSASTGPTKSQLSSKESASTLSQRVFASHSDLKDDSGSDGDSDEDIPVKPLAQVRKRPPIFDSPEASTSKVLDPAHIPSDLDTADEKRGETDDDDLSEYELEQRRKRGQSSPVKAASDSQSGPQCADRPALPIRSSASRSSQDQSGPFDNEPRPVIAPASLPVVESPIPEPSRSQDMRNTEQRRSSGAKSHSGSPGQWSPKRQKHEIQAEAGERRDTSTPPQNVSTPASVLSYLNPLSYFRSQSVPRSTAHPSGGSPISTSVRKPSVEPPLLARLRESSEDVPTSSPIKVLSNRAETQAEALEVLEEEQQAGESARSRSQEQGPNPPNQSLPSEQRPDVGDLSTSSEHERAEPPLFSSERSGGSPSRPPAGPKITASPKQAKPADSPSRMPSSRPAPLSPRRAYRTLREFKPNFTVDGLDEAWAQKVLQAAVAKRAAQRAK